MGAEYPREQLGRLVNNFDARRIPLSSREREKRRGPYPYYGATGVMDYIDDYLFEGLHLLIAEDGSVETDSGKPFLQLVDGRFWVNNHAHVLTGASDDETRFLYYALSTVAIRPYMTGSVQAKLSQANLNRIAVPCPPDPDVRRAIAAVLGALDDKIELNRRMCRTLEGIARAIFQAWFVDFEPVRAKAAGAKSFRGMPQAVFDTLPTQFAPACAGASPLGPIPKGWTVACAGDVAEVNASTLGRSDDLDYIDYIEISEVMRGEIGQIVRYERGNEPSRAKRRLRHGDTVLSTVRPDRGAYFLCLNPPETLIASTGFAVLSPRNGMWAFLYSAMTRPDVSDELGRLADGGAYPAVRPEVVAAREFAVPGDPAVIRAFEALAEPLFEKAWHCRQQSKTLAALRDALLPKLVSGELRIKAAERPAS